MYYSDKYYSVININVFQFDEICSNKVNGLDNLTNDGT